MENKIFNLALQVKKLMVDAGYSAWGGKGELANEIGVSLATLSKAINGHRVTPHYYNILIRARDHLRTQRDKI